MPRTSLTALAAAVALVAGPMAAAPAFAREVPVAQATVAAEALLKTTIADIQAGTPNYAGMSPELVAAMKAQAGATEQLKALGAAKTFARVGDGENPWTWAVTFETGMVLNWTIALAPDGTIIGLQIQPAA